MRLWFGIEIPGVYIHPTHQPPLTLPQQGDRPMRTVTLLLLVLILATSMASSQAKPGGIARELAMGAASTDRNIAVNPFIVMDPTWLLGNPAYLQHYGDYAWFDIAGGTVNGYGGENVYGNQFGGVNFAFGKQYSVGAILSYDASVTNNLWNPLNNYILNSTRPTANPATSLGSPRPIEVFEVLAAASLDNLEVGAGISYGWSNQDFTSTSAPPTPITSDGSLKAHTLGIRAGLRMDFGGGSLFEGSVATRFDKATDKFSIGGSGNGTGTSEYGASATELEANVRLGLKMSKRVTIVPYAALRTYSVEPKEAGRLVGQTETKFTYKESILSMSFGLGGEVKVKEMYLAGGVSFAILRDKTETNTNATTTSPTTTSTFSISAFPVFNLGVEYPVLEWLTLRGGYYRALASATTKTEVSTGGSTERSQSLGSSSVNFGGFGSVGGDEKGLMTLGLGLKFGGFALDATVSEQALRRGLGVIGASDNINTFGYCTLSYCFE
jgi:hypothetical protein